jgi:hypothetical protein
MPVTALKDGVNDIKDKSVKVELFIALKTMDLSSVPEFAGTTMFS